METNCQITVGDRVFQNEADMNRYKKILETKADKLYSLQNALQTKFLKAYLIGVQTGTRWGGMKEFAELRGLVDKY